MSSSSWATAHRSINTRSVSKPEKADYRQKAGIVLKSHKKTIPKDSRTIAPCSSAKDPHKIFFLTRAAYKQVFASKQSVLSLATAHNLNLQWKGAVGNPKKN